MLRVRVPSIPPLPDLTSPFNSSQHPCYTQIRDEKFIRRSRVARRRGPECTSCPRSCMSETLPVGRVIHPVVEKEENRRVDHPPNLGAEIVRRQGTNIERREIFQLRRSMFDVLAPTPPPYGAYFWKTSSLIWMPSPGSSGALIQPSSAMKDSPQSSFRSL